MLYMYVNITNVMVADSWIKRLSSHVNLTMIKITGEMGRISICAIHGFFAP